MEISRYNRATGAATPKPSGYFSREEIEVILGFALLFFILGISECYAMSSDVFLLYEIGVLLRSVSVLIMYFTSCATIRYFQDFYGKRKHRWEKGCSSYGRIPCPGMRLNPEQWATRECTKPHQRGILDFDHIQLKFLDYLWCRLAVALPFHISVLWKMFSFSYQRATQLRVYARRRLVSWGILKKLKFPKAEEAFANFILSCSGGIFYRGPLNHKEDGSVEATFVIDNAAIFPEAGKVTYDKFVAIVDVENKVLISAHYGSVKLSPEDALLMIVNELFTHVHPQLHAWANYGVSVCSPHWFVARMSKVTVAYNYKGSDGAPKYLEMNHQMGLADKCNGKTYIGKKGYKHGEVRTGFLARIQEHSPTHRDIYDLAPYSPFIDFVIKIRTFFMEEFKKYADNDFVGIHPEGLFLATIMHSLDHEMAFLIDVHRLEAENEMLRGVEEHMIAFHHLADGCHWFPFAYRFKDAPHPFYQSVYEFAHKLNPKLAEDLDACIIR